MNQQTKPFVILVHPPVTRPCEPPAGISRIAGALMANGIDCMVLDANLRCLLLKLGEKPSSPDTWTRRAWLGRERNLSALKSRLTYGNIGIYTRAVKDLSRLLSEGSRRQGCRITLSDYADGRLSPLKSKDLLRAAEQPEANPFFPMFKALLDEAIRYKEPDIIGFSLNYLGQALCCFSMMGYLRRDHPGLKLVLGGGLVGSWMSGPGRLNLFSGLVDEMIAGPGEERLIELAKGVRAEGPYMPYYGWAKGEGYLSPGFILPYSASMGCYWRRCAFCPEKAEGSRYMPIPHLQAAHQIETLQMALGPSLIHILDNAISPSLLDTLARDPPGAPWYGFARISKELADEDLALALRSSGCVMLKLGLESGDQGVLDRLEKGIDLETASRVLGCLKKYGISTYVYLLFGTPVEGEKEALRTLDFVVSHKDEIGFLNIAIFNMPAWGTEASLYETKDFYEGDLALYRDFRHPLGWDRLRVRRFLDRVFRRHPAVSGIIKRDPPVFTSNHAPFFAMEDVGLPRAEKVRPLHP
jgi:hypothetical protein